MGFIQKLSSRSKNRKGNINTCPCCRNPIIRKEYKIPKLTWKYIMNLKNWK